MNHFSHPLAEVIHEMQQDLARKSKPKPIGDFEFDKIVDGIRVTATYNVSGSYLAATRDDPAEYPVIDIVSVHVGDERVPDEFIDAWDSRCELLADIEEMEQQI